MPSSQEGWSSNLRYQISDAISFLGINPKNSGGWKDEVKKPVIDDLEERVNKIISTLLAEARKEERKDNFKLFDKILNDALGNKEMADDPKDPKIRISYLKKQLKHYQIMKALAQS